MSAAMTARGALCFVLLGCIVALGYPAAAKELASADSAIEVTADKSLEWYKEKHLYVARGNAKAVRGDTTIEADILTAHQRDAGASKSSSSGPEAGNLDRLTAEGHVRITDPRQQVFGDRAIYDLNSRSAIVTGKDLKYLTAKDTVTAKDALEYYETEDKAVARGNAVAVHDDRHIEGDVLTAYFEQNAEGQKDISRMTAEGNVTVITATDISRGDRATYDAKTNTAVLTGHVRITRQDTQLSGDQAEVDFAKGESRLINQGTGRVRALLTPKE